MPKTITKKILRVFTGGEISPTIMRFDPDVLNGNPLPEVTSTMGAGSSSGTLTVEAIRRARELLNGNTPDFADAMMYGVSPAMGLLRDQRELERAREAQRHAEMTATEVLRRQENYSRPMIEVRIDERPDFNNTFQVTTCMRELNRQTLVERDFFTPENFDTIARQTAAEMSERIYHETLAALLRAEEERQRERYGRGAARDTFDHWGDLMRHGTSAIMQREPVAEGPIAWMADLKNKVIEHKGWKATALDTTDLIKAEGKAMEHCFAGYVRRCVAEEYIAFHIDAPQGTDKKWPKSGFTVGFKVTKDGKKREFRYDQIKGKKNNTHYVGQSEVVEMMGVIEKAIGAKTEKKKKSGYIDFREVYA